VDRLYISDLDGTLLRSNAELSDFSRERLTRLIEAGALFTVASARSVVAMGLILGRLPVRLPVIANNGACLSDLATGAHHVVHELDGSLSSEIIALAEGAAGLPAVAALRGDEERLYIPDPGTPGMTWYLEDRVRAQDYRLRPWADARPDGPDRVLSMSFVHRREVIDELTPAIQERFASRIAINQFENHYTPGWFWLVVQDRCSTKDQAIRDLIALEGLEGRELVTFGDQLNDLAMFRVADVAIAVGNAAAEVKAQADEAIGTNDEDSVVKRILRDFAPGPA